MIREFERRQFVVYLLNAVSRVTAYPELGERLAKWAEAHRMSLGIPVESNATPVADPCSSFVGLLPPLRMVEEAARLSLRGGDSVPPSRLARNIEALGGALGLDGLELRIFGLAVHCEIYGIVTTLLNVFDSGDGLGVAMAALLGEEPRAVSARLALSGALLGSGLVIFMHDCYIVEPISAPKPLGVPRHLVHALTDTEAGDIEALLSALVGRPVEPELEWDDFSHLGEPRALAADLLAGALRGGEAGINLLLYGPPGTGKSEFCRTLARHLGAELFLIGETDGGSREPSRDRRLAQLLLAEELLSQRGNTLLLFDEMEDLLADRNKRVSKIFINRVLEQVRVPVLWTCNDTSDFERAMIRRMSLAIEMRLPPAAVRQKVWRRNLARCRVEIGEADLQALARLEAPPALAAASCRAASLAGGGTERLRLVATSLAKAMGGTIEAADAGNGFERFDPALTNSAIDLGHLAERLGRSGAPRDFSLCLFGPPGTGKSAYLRHLAERLGMPVLQKRASDVLGMFVGQSEKNIAGAFAEAREQGAFLVFDEADSLLSDRVLAGRSWEVSQVNEMLTWMESHPLPFACTTNLMERLDPASLRRFTVKARLDFLTPSQSAAAFAHFFGLPAPVGLADLTTLTPGDFRLVERKVRILGESGNAAALLRMLEEECEAKPLTPRRIGFVGEGVGSD
jgi:transitional endoplasmic reticulum ATPase